MHVPFGHWHTQTFVAGLRCHGLTAPWVLDGPMNRCAFEAYIETQLAPTLSKGDVVIMDNLSSHKGPRVTELIQDCGAWPLFLPPYSPPPALEVLDRPIRDGSGDIPQRTTSRRSFWRKPTFAFTNRGFS
jgi:hypothetical protein